jgi:hypothetical protein
MAGGAVAGGAAGGAVWADAMRLARASVAALAKIREKKLAGMERIGVVLRE